MQPKAWLHSIGMQIILSRREAQESVKISKFLTVKNKLDPQCAMMTVNIMVFLMTIQRWTAFFLRKCGKKMPSERGEEAAWEY